MKTTLEQLPPEEVQRQLDLKKDPNNKSKHAKKDSKSVDAKSIVSELIAKTKTDKSTGPGKDKAIGP